MKKLLTLALILTILLSACAEPTKPPTENPDNSTTTTTTTPPTTTTTTTTATTPDTPPPQNNDNHLLALQIIDSRSGIFRLHDPDLKETYPLPNSDFEDYQDEMYKWYICIMAGDVFYHINIGMHNFSWSENRFSRVNVNTFVTNNAGDEDLGDFTVKRRIEDKNIFFEFSIPEKFDFDINDVDTFSYWIVKVPEDIEIRKYVNPKDIIVSDINS